MIDINQRTAQFISALEQQFSPAEWGVASNNALVNMIGESSIANQQQQANAPTRPSDEQPAVSTGDPPESVIVVGHFQTVTMQPVADGNDGAVSMETESPCIEIAPTHGITILFQLERIFLIFMKIVLSDFTIFLYSVSQMVARNYEERKLVASLFFLFFCDFVLINFYVYPYIPEISSNYLYILLFFYFSVSFVSTEAVPDCHKYKTQTLNPHNPRTFNSAVMRDIKLLKKDLPPGITIKSFEDRIVS